MWRDERERREARPTEREEQNKANDWRETALPIPHIKSNSANKNSNQYRIIKTKPKKTQFNEVVEESTKLCFLLSKWRRNGATQSNGGTDKNSNLKTLKKDSIELKKTTTLLNPEPCNFAQRPQGVNKNRRRQPKSDRREHKKKRL